MKVSAALALTSITPTTSFLPTTLIQRCSPNSNHPSQILHMTTSNEYQNEEEIDESLLPTYNPPPTDAAGAELASQFSALLSSRNVTTMDDLKEEDVSNAMNYKYSRSSKTSRPGMGMGMGTKKKSSKGMGKKKSTKDKKASFDVAKALIKSEKRYEELLTESSKAYASAEYEDEIVDITTEYVVAARAKPGSAAGAASDWIPVAQVCIVRPIHDEEKDGELDASVPVAVSYYCREIHHAACRASPSTFQSLSRSNIEYSVEPYDSFAKYVYEEVIEGKSSSGSHTQDGATVAMTKTKAREVMGLDSGCKDPAAIKQAYKKLMFEFHPDRYNTADRSQVEMDAASERFFSIKVAYETLTSGVRGTEANGNSSWYASLGGNSRTEFVGPIELMPVEKAGVLCNRAFKAAVIGVDPDLSMAFVARNQAAAKR